MSNNPYQDDLDDIRYGYVSDENLPCDHEEYDVDWEGRATCAYCRYSWWLTGEQMESYHRWEQEYYEAMERENLPLGLMSRLKQWIRSLIPQRPLVVPPLPDDEIPF